MMSGTATFASRVTGFGSKTGQDEVIAVVQLFFFVGRKLSRLEQLATALFLSLSRCPSNGEQQLKTYKLYLMLAASYVRCQPKIEMQRRACCRCHDRTVHVGSN